MGFSAYSRLKQSMHKQQTRLGSTIAVIVFGASANLSVASEVIDYAQMNEKVRSGDYINAMSLAESYRSEHEGDICFDYTYGRIAYFNQKYDQAAFALERVVLNDPNDYKAHMLLAATYVEIGNVDAATYELAYVREQASDEELVEVADAQLQQLTNQTHGSAWEAAVEVGAGYDDNYNLGLDSSTVEFNGSQLTVSNDRRKQDSFFNDLAVDGTYRFSKKSALNLRLWHRGYYDGQQQTEFTVRNVYTFRDLKFPVTLSGELRPLLIDGDFSRLVTSLSGLVDLDKENKTLRPQIISRLTHLTFDDSTQERVRAMVGFRLGYAPSAWHHAANILASTEWAMQTEGEQYARNAIGLTYDLSYHYQNGNSTSLSTSYQNYQYQDDFSTSNERRQSSLFYATLKHEWQIGRASNINAMYRFIDGASNIDFFDYQRNFVRVGFGYQF
ncbi:tetratricopeptide repeat protein [Thalassolituus oleivorans]|jgi:hypothetical protein|uniref:tetratricopeptide repeat protein n=1 Tax=Thalassolituus oleivorans TaxID=187493 RepID=UPI0023F1E24D|nr:tetratricopeptide repeat protein [Thalassolituus oleivorans]